MPVYLSLGSNVGDRMENLRKALQLLGQQERVRVGAASRIYETEPIGIVEQPTFLNMAVEIETELAPLEFLKAIKGVEAEMGRIPSARWGPRLIDIDIVLWDDRVVEHDALVIPHPEFRSRAFVLKPLAEIAGDAVDPVSGKSVEELASETGAQGWVRRYEPAEAASG